MSSYVTRMTKGYKVSHNLNFGHNYPPSIQKMSDHGLLGSVSLALNDDQNETDYLPPPSNLKTAGLGPVV